MMFPIHIKTASGLENVVARELQDLGVQGVTPRKRVVIIQGDLTLLYKINLWSRCAIRVLRPIANFPASDEKTFYDQVKAIDWSPWLSSTGTLAIDAHVHSSFTTHSLFLAQLTKDAICDQFREKTGERPSVDLGNPDLRLAVNLFKNRVELSLDSSGESLHKRGYRKQAGEAPLNEALAAGIIKLSGWDGSVPLLDPMTGSATLAIEAGLIAKNMAPGLLRKTFGFQKWKDYAPSLFETLVNEAQNSVRDIPQGLIRAFDKDPSVIALAQKNIERAGLKDCIQLDVADFMKQEEPLESSGVIVMNPPYDERLAVEDLAKFCFDINQNLKQSYSNWTSYVLMGNKEAAKELGSSKNKTFPLFNGAIECELVEVRPNENRLETQETPQDDLTSLLALHPNWENRRTAFANRLKKNLKHYSKWAQRERVTCWRLYDRDIPELPFLVDIFGKHLHIAEVPRNHDHSPLEHRKYLELMKQTASEIVQIPIEKTYLKTRKAQKLPKSETTKLVEVRERGHKFLVNFVDYVDVGLFLEYRKVREWVENEAKGKDFLNLFSYTGTATVCAAAGGALSTGSVDASSTYLEWTRKNMDLNELRGAQHIYYRSDVMEFLNSSKKVYDFCWVDPPVHSINRNTAVEFDVQKDHVTLLQKVSQRIKPGGMILFTTHCQSFQLQEWAIKESCHVEITDMTHTLTPPDFERTPPFQSWLLRVSVSQ